MGLRFETLEADTGWHRVTWENGEALVRVDDGRVAAVQVDEPTPDKLRRFPLRRIENALDALRDEHARAAASAGGRRYRLRRPPGRRLDDAFYERVARVYRDAVARGLDPRKTMRNDTQAADATVATWVMEARRRGFLPPAQPGKVST